MRTALGYTHSATNMIRLWLAWAPDADRHDKILIHLASANHGREEILQPNKNRNDLLPILQP
jgi:hypothetical protein